MVYTLDGENNATEAENEGKVDPVLILLEQVESEYVQVKNAWHLEERRLLDDLGEAQQDIQRQNTEIELVLARVAELEQGKKKIEHELRAAKAQVEQAQAKAAQQKDRANHLAGNLKDIHKALFSGDVYNLILKACISITGATRGVYLTTRGAGENSFQARAAMDIDGYPKSGPSPFMEALCRKVLAENDTLVCNGDDEIAHMTETRRPDEHFRNCIAAPVVLMRNLNGIVIVADKITGDFSKEDVETLISVGDQAGVAIENHQLQLELQDAYVATVSMLADAVEAKDPYTHGHCDLVSHYARLTAERMGLSEYERSIVCYAALLHDVGKIGVSDGILHKPGPLMPEERDLMRSHVRVGHDLIARVPIFSAVANVVLHHHEWYDGSGYPAGLKGEEIPIGARIVCVVDSYCAMITKRSYKDAYSDERARSELLRCAGSQFDQDVVDAFLALLDSPEAENMDETDTSCSAYPNLAHIRQYEMTTH
ncbi:MAG: HD domain-containing protein [Chloroflexota bacterium]|nr:HD domain-containing protein [Chloroflexota bacterium]